MEKAPLVFFVAGRSGGHILPGLTLANTYKKTQHAKIVFFSTNTRMDNDLISKHASVDHYIPFTLDNVPNAIWRYPFFLARAAHAFIKSLYYMFKFKPEQVVSMGGYVSLPVCLAARCARVPYSIFELNAIPGKATTFLAASADTVYTCFSDTAYHLPKAHCVMADYPLRFNTDERNSSHQHALESLGFSSDRKVIFVVGGSQGSLFINSLIKEWIIQNPSLHTKIQVIHQTGAQDTTDWHSFYAQYKIPAIIFDYHDRLQDYYIASDLIICRSGAGTLHEILFFEKPCITVPLETASTDHQVDNAKNMAHMYPHLFTVLLQKDVMQNSQHAFAAISQALKI